MGDKNLEEYRKSVEDYKSGKKKRGTRDDGKYTTPR